MSETMAELERRVAALGAATMRAIRPDASAEDIRRAEETFKNWGDESILNPAALKAIIDKNG